MNNNSASDSDPFVPDDNDRDSMVDLAMPKRAKFKLNLDLMKTGGSGRNQSGVFNDRRLNEEF